MKLSRDAILRLHICLHQPEICIKGEREEELEQEERLRGNGLIERDREGEDK